MVEFEDGEFQFDELIKESGHSVVHIVLFDLDEKQEINKTLTDYGCGVNTTVAVNYLVIDVPAVVSYYEIKAFLNKKKSYNTIDYPEPCLSYKHWPYSN